MAARAHPLWVLGVVTTALASIGVALTGCCVVGNILARLSFTPMLARPGWQPGQLYFMQTDRWYLERRIYLAVGINLTVASGLSLVHSPWWLLFTGFAWRCWWPPGSAHSGARWRASPNRQSFPKVGR